MKKTIRDVFSKEEISLMDIYFLFYHKRKIILYSVLIVLSIGLLRNVTTPTQYESLSSKILEGEGRGGASMGQLSGLAGLAGINLPTGSGANNLTFPTELYPQLIESRPFIIGLLDQEFYFTAKNEKRTLKQYYLEERPGDIVTKSALFVLGLPSRITSIFHGDESRPVAIVDSGDNQALLRISREDEYVMALLKRNIAIETKGSLINLSVKMPEPLVAAELNNIIFDKVVEHVTAYKTEKQRLNLRFIEESTIESEKNFRRAQISLASFRDNNQGIISQRARTQEELLQSEFNLTFNIYNNLKQELENAKIQLKRETPLFATFEEVIVPNSPSNPSLLITILFSIGIGLFIGIFITVVALILEYNIRPVNDL